MSVWTACNPSAFRGQKTDLNINSKMKMYKDSPGENLGVSNNFIDNTNTIHGGKLLIRLYNIKKWE